MLTCGDHFIIHTNIKSLFCTPETHITLYVNYTAIKQALEIFYLLISRYQLLENAMLCYAMLSHFSCVRLCATPQTAAHKASPSLGFPGKNTGVGCHFLLRCMKVKSESEVAQSCPTLSDPMDCSLPGSSVYGIFQARVLEWGAIQSQSIQAAKMRKTLS